MRRITSHIIFLHIPKAGGTTLRSILESQYAKCGVFMIGEDINGDIKRFKTMSIEEREQITLLMGHMSHGLCRYFSAPSTYLTLLRNPVERVFSEYRFLSSNRQHPLFEVVHDLNFQEYLAIDPTRQGSNGQTRLLSGIAYQEETGIPGIHPIEKADFEIAMQNLKKFYPMVGLLEKFDETLMLWKQHLSWRLPFYVKKNITIRADTNLSESDTDLINTKNRYDLKLYHQATKMLEEKLECQSYLFMKQLSLFKIMNKFYQKLVT